MIIELDKLTLFHLLARSFQKYADLPAISSVGEPSITYRRLAELVEDISGRLTEAGIQKEDRVALLGENSPNWVIAYLGIIRMGAVAVPILPGFPDSDTRHIIRDSGARAIFIEEKQRSKVEGSVDLPVQWVIGLEEFSLDEISQQSDGIIRKTIDKIRESRQSKEFSETRLPDESDLAVIIYTSGTTGHSKGVMLTHKNIVYDVVHAIERFPINEKDRFLSILPLSHTFEATGGCLCPLTVGASITYIKGLPTPEKLLSAMALVHPTAVLAVPLVIDKIFRKRVLPEIQKKAVLKKLYGLPFLRRAIHRMAGRKLSRSLGGALRFFMFGGASLNQDVEIFLREAGISYSTGYGMTETAPIMTINPFGKVKVGSCGRPIPGIEMKIHEPDPYNDVGEIVVRGPIIMSGYYKNQKATADSFLAGGWLKTGDLGYFDSERYLFIKGRIKNMIVGPSGKNIYPEVIEEMLLKSPYIQEVVVYEKQGRVHARAYLDYDALDREFAQLKLDGSQYEKEVLEILEKVRLETNKELPAYSAIISIVEHPEPFEKTPTNKVKRYLYVKPPTGNVH